MNIAHSIRYWADVLEHEGNDIATPELRKLADGLDAHSIEIRNNAERIRKGTLKLTADYLDIIADKIGAAPNLEIVDVTAE